VREVQRIEQDFDPGKEILDGLIVKRGGLSRANGWDSFEFEGTRDAVQVAVRARDWCV
jgi:hypothetical protein